MFYSIGLLYISSLVWIYVSSTTTIGYVDDMYFIAQYFCYQEASIKVHVSVKGNEDDITIIRCRNYFQPNLHIYWRHEMLRTFYHLEL